MGGNWPRMGKVLTGRGKRVAMRLGAESPRQRARDEWVGWQGQPT